MRMWLVGLAGALLALLEGTTRRPSAQQLSPDLPHVLPDLSGWEKVSGSAELDDPPTSLRYEFYVHPLRQARYEVIRYSVARAGTAEAAADPGTEKLQWQVADKELRRFACEPPRPGRSCQWRELAKGSGEYDREVSVILWVLGVHRRLLREREGLP